MNLPARPVHRLGRERRLGHDGRVSSLGPVTLLMYDAHGRGGVARSVFTLASRLAGHHDVRVLSLFGGPQPHFPLDPRVDLEVLLPGSPAAPRRVAGLPRHRRTALRPQPAERHLTTLTDRVLRRRLARLGPGTLVSTRPSLHLAAVRWCPSDVRLVGWDHKNFPTRFGNVRQAELLTEVVPVLDAYVVLTNADAEDYGRELPAMGTRLEVIRNALPWPVATDPAPLTGRTIVAAGRLEREKGFDRLLDAFAPVAHAHPDWRLLVVGEGPQHGPLEAQAARLGLAGRVELPGYADDLAPVLREASVLAMTSRAEGFPLVLTEAMSQGVPVVAMDCPRGPGEIVLDGKNGLLVPDGDVVAMSDALQLMVEDEELRHACGTRALADAGQYSASRVADHWLGLLAGLDD